MYDDKAEPVNICPQCHIMKGHYTGPHTQWESLVANNPLDLMCINFLKTDPSKDSKENV